MAEGQEEKKQVRVVMWGTPRSLSTAVFRAMWNKKSCKCMPEPYCMSYMFSEERTCEWFPEIPPVPEFNFKHIKRELYENTYPTDEVFVKDFPLYIYSQKTHDPRELIPQGYVHTFLLRNPQACIESTYRIFISKEIKNWTNWDNRSVGYQELWDFYNIIKEIQPNPLVIVADDVHDNPEGTLRLLCERTGLKFEEAMLNWNENDGLKEKMDAFIPFLSAFTDTVMTTSGLASKAASSKPKLQLPPEVQADVDKANVYYEKLLQFATRVPPAAQKPTETLK